MQAAQNGRPLNPNRAVQSFEEIGDSDRRYSNYEESELPDGAQARLNQGEATVLPPRETVSQAWIARQLGRRALVVTAARIRSSFRVWVAPLA